MTVLQEQSRRQNSAYRSGCHNTHPQSIFKGSSHFEVNCGTGNDLCSGCRILRNDHAGWRRLGRRWGRGRYCGGGIRAWNRRRRRGSNVDVAQSKARILQDKCCATQRLSGEVGHEKRLRRWGFGRQQADLGSRYSAGVRRRALAQNLVRGCAQHFDLRDCAHVQSAAEDVDLCRALAFPEHVRNLHPLRA